MSQTLLAVIDDEPDFAAYVEDVGRSAGYAVRTFTHADAFFEGEEARPCPADIVVLDIVMPGMDGIEFLARLRKTERRPPLILVTSYGDTYLTAAQEIARSSGFTVTRTLIKPIRRSELDAAIQETVRLIAQPR